MTAGSRGLGRAIVLDLARRGANVSFTYASREDAAQSLVEEVKSLGRLAVATQADVRNAGLAERVVADTANALGRLDILVCNAGIARSGPIVSMSDEDWSIPVDVSLTGAFNYIRPAGRVFQKQNYGKIVVVGSINGMRGRPGTASYNAAKAGLIGLVKTAAAELGRANVNVNLIAPGFVDTEGQARTPEIVRNLVLNECAIKRLATPEDIAPVVSFLASDLARHITGQAINVDGGQHL